MNECLNSPCSQECANVYGSYQCYCRRGYQLSDVDGVTCEGEGTLWTVGNTLTLLPNSSISESTAESLPGFHHLVKFPLRRLGWLLAFPLVELEGPLLGLKVKLERESMDCS